MGYWNDMAAEIERVLGDELNPTDAYGRPIAVGPRRTMRLGSGDLKNFGREPVGPFTESGRVTPAGYRVSEEDDEARGIPAPEWPWPLPPVPGSKRWEENQKIARDLQQWWDGLFERRSAAPREADCNEERKACRELVLRSAV